jgi:hypothetical protein
VVSRQRNKTVPAFVKRWWTEEIRQHTAEFQNEKLSPGWIGRHEGMDEWDRRIMNREQARRADQKKTGRIKYEVSLLI